MVTGAAFPELEGTTVVGGDSVLVITVAVKLIPQIFGCVLSVYRGGIEAVRIFSIPQLLGRGMFYLTQAYRVTSPIIPVRSPGVKAAFFEA